MKVFIDRINDKVFIKNEGKVTEGEVVKRKPTNDPAPQVDPKQVTFDSALIELKATIIDTKQKAELYNLGIESKENLDKKVAEYKTAKTKYDLAKAALEG